MALITIFKIRHTDSIGFLRFQTFFGISFDGKTFGSISIYKGKDVIIPSFSI